MQFSKYKRIGILTAAAVASLQAASLAYGAGETIYFTDADNGAPVDLAAPGTPALPQLTDTGSGANTGVFTPSGGANSILTVVGGNSLYVPAYANDINSAGGGDTSDYVHIGGFTPTTDNVFIGLKLDAGGVPISPSDTTDLDTIINSINVDNNFAFGTNIASLVPASFDGVFGGYDILLSVPNSFASAGTGAN